jgi:hypothetical protein
MEEIQSVQQARQQKIKGQKKNGTKIGARERTEESIPRSEVKQINIWKSYMCLRRLNSIDTSCFLSQSDRAFSSLHFFFAAKLRLWSCKVQTEPPIHCVEVRPIQY